jgi:hypothetical protein
MADIVVKYNGTTITPAPLVQQNYQFVDYGSRWGNIIEIELNGTVTGITNPLAVQSGFAAIFTGQFGTLDVYEGNTSIYKWNNIVIDEISFPQNHLFLTSLAPYSVKLKSINVPSGVLEPVNEYNFTQGDDGLVSVVHKISARGIRTANGGLANAIAFVQNFVGQNPFSAALGPSFSASGSGVLVNFAETIDRAGGVYSVQETYKYNTGLFNPYYETWNVSVGDIVDNEWLTVDVDWKLQGSPVKNNLSSVESSVSNIKPLNKIGSMGYDTGNFIQANTSFTRDTGAASVQIKTSYVSGYSAADISGYLDYTVTLIHDGLLPKEDWRIEGDFVCFGPRDYRLSRLNQFKGTYGSDWRNYLTGLIISSPVYQYHDSSKTFGSMSDLDIRENTGLAQFHISLSTVDGGYPDSMLYPKYTIEMQPHKWAFDLLPAANIEGHYVLQDLQMLSQAKAAITVNAESSSVGTCLISTSGFVNTLSNLYISNGFITSETYNTGILDATMTREILGTDLITNTVTTTKVAGSTLTNYQRKPGYKFGY